MGFEHVRSIQKFRMKLSFLFGLLMLSTHLLFSVQANGSTGKVQKSNNEEEPGTGAESGTTKVPSIPQKSSEAQKPVKLTILRSAPSKPDASPGTVLETANRKRKSCTKKPSNASEKPAGPQQHDKSNLVQRKSSSPSVQSATLERKRKGTGSSAVINEAKDEEEPGTGAEFGTVKAPAGPSEPAESSQQSSENKTTSAAPSRPPA